jgi:hypothetical protein
VGYGGAGSELCLAVDAAKKIEESGKKARVVSAVCWELFEEQDDSYKKSVLPDDVTARVSSSARPHCPRAASCLPGCIAVEHRESKGKYSILHWECHYLSVLPSMLLAHQIATALQR